MESFFLTSSLIGKLTEDERGKVKMGKAKTPFVLLAKDVK
jgi:hypothetical protein